MQSKDLENHIEFLLSAALQKCGNIYDAEDLTQETLLAALSYMARGKEIRDVKAWLLVVYWDGNLMICSVKDISNQ